ncbi:MAG: glycerate kinase [Bacilli bacterium]|nr:glycerate kinase [Bacilli bacterium]
MNKKNKLFTRIINKKLFNILIAMDSFKGTFSSYTINNIIKDCLLKYKNDDIDNITCVNIADGGEGSVEAIISGYNNRGIEAFVVNKKVEGPFLKLIDSYYGIVRINNKTLAFIEVSSVVGFKYKEKHNDPGRVTTYGVGELIKDAIYKYNVEEIYICLGGSISNDCGVGMCASLGYEFYDSKGFCFIPDGKTLNNIVKIKKDPNMAKLLEKVKIYCLCDVTNPLYGPKGASFVFARQKGATEEDLVVLDDNLKFFSKLCEKDLGVDPNDVYSPGSGAAGGIGYAVHSLLDGEILSGIKTILRLNDFDNLIEKADIVITGEGKIDSQSFDGKVISEIRDRCEKENKKLIGIFGSIDLDNEVNFDVYSLFQKNEVKDLDNKALIEESYNRIDKIISEIKL